MFNMSTHLPYNLCLELKEVGFPQEYHKEKPWGDFAYYDGDDLHLLHKDNDTRYYIGNDYCTQWTTLDEFEQEEEQDKLVKCPTLSELIKACGDKFDRLERIGSGFKAISFGSPYSEPVWEIESTPEEAVTKLYLAVHKK